MIKYFLKILSCFVYFPLSGAWVSRTLHSSPLRWWLWTVSWSSRKWRRSWRRRTGTRLAFVPPLPTLHLRARSVRLISPDHGWLSGAESAAVASSALCSWSESALNISSWPRQCVCVCNTSVNSEQNWIHCCRILCEFSTIGRKVRRAQTAPETWTS